MTKEMKKRFTFIGILLLVVALLFVFNKKEPDIMLDRPPAFKKALQRSSVNK